MNVLIVIIFGIAVMVGVALVLNQVSTWIYSTFGSCARWLARRRRH